MNFTSSLKLLALLACAASVGCELQPCPEDDTGEDTEEVKEGSCTVFKSTKRFVGDAEVQNTDWASGAEVVIDATLGDVRVIEGTTDNQVSVTATPFVRRAHDVSDEEARQSMEPFELRVGTDTDGTVQVLTLRNGGNSTLGGDVVVELPRGFDGALTITNQTGQTKVETAGEAVSVSNTVGDVEVTVASISSVDLSVENGDITASFGAIADGATGGTIVSEFGAVILGMPGSGDYYVGATARDLVDFGTPPGTCVEEVAAENSKSLTCNGAAEPQFTVTAEGLGGEVTVSYN